MSDHRSGRRANGSPKKIGRRAPSKKSDHGGGDIWNGRDCRVLEIRTAYRAPLKRALLREIAEA